MAKHSHNRTLEVTSPTKLPTQDIQRQLDILMENTSLIKRLSNIQSRVFKPVIYYM